MGAAGVVTFVMLDRLRRRYSELSLLVYGFVITGIGAIALAPVSSAGSPISLDRFVFGYTLVWSIGSPLTGALVIVAFSKILGDKLQGGYMGYIGSAGSLARIILPIALGATGSQQVALGAVAGLCFLCCFVVLAYYVRVQDVQEQAQLERDQAQQQQLGSSDYASMQGR
jgi:nitrate/nitrite transporter NarK